MSQYVLCLRCPDSVCVCGGMSVGGVCVGGGALCAILGPSS